MKRKPATKFWHSDCCGLKFDLNASRNLTSVPRQWTRNLASKTWGRSKRNVAVQNDTDVRHEIWQEGPRNPTAEREIGIWWTISQHVTVTYVGNYEEIGAQLTVSIQYRKSQSRYVVLSEGRDVQLAGKPGANKSDMGIRREI